MKFMILNYEPKEDFEARTDETRKEHYWTRWKAYTQSMRDAGILAYPGNVLQPVYTAYTARNENGSVQAKEGSFAETKEQLGGYYIIDVPNANAAVEWASRAPGAVNGTVEIRPVL